MFWTNIRYVMLEKENSNIVWCIVNVFLNVFLAVRMCCWWSTSLGWFENNFQVVQNNSEGGLDVLDWLEVKFEKKTAIYICYIVNVFLNVFLAIRMCCWWSTPFGWFENNYQVVKNNSEGGLDVLDWLEVKFEKENSNIYMLYCECVFECIFGHPNVLLVVHSVWMIGKQFSGGSE